MSLPCSVARQPGLLLPRAESSSVGHASHGTFVYNLYSPTVDMCLTSVNICLPSLNIYLTSVNRNFVRSRSGLQATDIDVVCRGRCTNACRGAGDKIIPPRHHTRWRGGMDSGAAAVSGLLSVDVVDGFDFVFDEQDVRLELFDLAVDFGKQRVAVARSEIEEVEIVFVGL